MTIDYPHAVLTCQYYILRPRFDDASTVKVNFSLELNLQTHGQVPDRNGKSSLMASLNQKDTNNNLKGSKCSDRLINLPDT